MRPGQRFGFSAIEKTERSRIAMKLSSSPPMQFVMTAVLAATLGFAIPVLVDRPKYARAVANYTKEPNKENQEALTLERATNRHVVWTTRAEAAAVLFVVMNAGCS
jgi:hypothetical protein